MSRRRRTETVQSFIGEDLKKQVNRLMENRRRLLAPFPVAADEIYRACWTGDELHAIHTLRGRKEMLREGRTIHISMPQGERQARITVKLSEDMPMPGYNLSVGFGELPLALANPIALWAPKWQDLADEQNRLLVKLEQVGKVCKTYGQLYRLWPDILSLFNSTGREKVGAARVASKLPDAVYEWVMEEGSSFKTRSSQIREMFRPEAFAPFTGMIAECLMLPTTPDNEVAIIS